MVKFLIGNYKFVMEVFKSGGGRNNYSSGTPENDLSETDDCTVVEHQLNKLRAVENQAEMSASSISASSPSPSKCTVTISEDIDEEYLVKIQGELKTLMTNVIRQFMETMTNDFLNLKMQLCREFTRREIINKKKWEGFYQTLSALAGEEDGTNEEVKSNNKENFTNPLSN